MFLGRRSRFERAQILAFAGFGIFLSRIEAVLAGFEFSNHDESCTASVLPRAARLIHRKWENALMGARGYRGARLFNALREFKG